jgi:hypothetical protein
MSKFYRSLLVLGLAFTVLVSCSKDDRDFALDLYVTVEDGTIAAQNALVHIYAPVDNSSVDYFLYTDESGKVSISLKNKAVVEIVATKRPYKSCSFAELERGVKTLYLDMTISGDPDSGCRDDQ